VIEIKLNGKKEEIAQNTNAADLLMSKKIDAGAIIVVINFVVVNTNNLKTTILKNNDEIELIKIVAGG
jgi:thiamine biosynthesis protein ThiS